MRNLQERLLELGFDPKGIDGIAGPNTAAAFEEFLKANGFKFDVSFTPSALTATGPYDQTELPWVQEAKRVMGRHESRDNSFLKKWLKSDGKTLGDPAQLPWCGDFVETCIRLALPAEPFKGRVAANPYLARNWLEFGQPCEPALGSVGVFWRGKKEGVSGHVGFLMGEDDASFYVLGGNQSNSVSVTRLDRGRFLGARWPVTFASIPARLPAMSPGTIPRTSNEL